MPQCLTRCVQAWSPPPDCPVNQIHRFTAGLPGASESASRNWRGPHPPWTAGGAEPPAGPPCSRRAPLLSAGHPRPNTEVPSGPIGPFQSKLGGPRGQACLCAASQRSSWPRALTSAPAFHLPRSSTTGPCLPQITTSIPLRRDGWKGRRAQLVGRCVFVTGEFLDCTFR